MLKIAITLNNAAGVLDEHEVDVTNCDADQMSDIIQSVIKNWTLAPGDTIKIGEA